MRECDATFLGLCLSQPATGDPAIFGFGGFLTALALLILVFNSSDALYKFRVAIAPLPLYRITFGAIIVIGLGTLLTDLWFAQRWYAPSWGVSRAEIQAIFGALFLLTTLLWIWFGFIRPPVFGRWNRKKFIYALYRTVVRGAEAELAIIAAEIGRSAECLVRYAGSSLQVGRKHARQEAAVDQTVGYAHDTLLLLANRKLCRHIVASSPGTAIALMAEASRQGRYHIPLGAFASRITTEALLNRDSILYHEDNYSLDLIGHTQPFSTAMYGDYRLVETIGSGMTSPLDVDWRVAWDFDKEQLQAYCRITLSTFKSFIAGGLYQNHSYSLFRAIDRIKESPRGLYELDKAPPDVSSDDASDRLGVAVGFADDVIKYLSEKQDLHFGRLRVGELGSPHRRENIFDDIASLMFELIHAAGYVRTDVDRTWWVQYNILWSGIFTFRQDSAAWRVLRFKLFRLVFDEIKRMKEFPNYKGARILGLCLNIMDFDDPKRTDHGKEYYPLRRAVLGWTRKNYLWLVRENPAVAQHCLAGGVTFEAENRRLVKTYNSFFDKEPSRKYLPLDESPPTTSEGDNGIKD